MLQDESFRADADPERAVPVRPCDCNARFVQKSHRVRRRVSEVVRLADAYQREPGRPRREGLGRESVDAPVMWDLQDVRCT